MSKAKTKPVIIVVPGGKISRSKLTALAKNPKRLDEDEADYQYSTAAIAQGGKPIPLARVLKKYGRR
jgi:hypothetical protein